MSSPDNERPSNATDEPKLHAVTEADSARVASQASRDEGDRNGRIAILLGIALAITLGLLAWSRVELSQRIDVLEADVTHLELEVAERDTVIGAQLERFDDVKTRVRELITVLDAPLPEAD